MAKKRLSQSDEEAMPPRYMAWLHSYICQIGVPSFQTCPLGKVHKDGHAILCATSFAYFIFIY